MSAISSQVILITGCSSGIGQALALELASRGHQVVATARRSDSLAPLAQHKGIYPLVVDVSDTLSIASAVSEVIARLGRIDILINNAGFSVVGPLIELPLGDVDGILATNVVGALAMVQAVALIGRAHV